MNLADSAITNLKTQTLMIDKIIMLLIVATLFIVALTLFVKP